MKSFLSDVLEDLQLNNRDLSKSTFILPSKRAGLFFKEEIKNKFNTSILIPLITSIEDFIEDLSSLTLIDNTKLLFEFYSIYIEITPKDKQDTFDVFSKWATIALQDFNEIDRHRIQAEYIFSYLQDINRIENWNLDQETDLTKNYFSFFSKLHLYYNKLYNQLLENKMAYQGMMYREAVDNINIYIENNQEVNHVFIGFNALNTSEEIIIKQLLENNLASVYWDADAYYFQNNQASIFLNNYKNSWKCFDSKPFNWIKNNFEKEKKIEVIGCPKNNTQIKYVGEILSKNVSNNFQNTALVLADESLLSLTLNSIPKKVNSINITMGYELKNVALSKLFGYIFKLYINSKNNSYYYKDILRILGTPSMQSICDSTSIIDQITKNNLTYLNKNTLLKLAPNNYIIDILFSKFSDNNIGALLTNIIELIQTIKNNTESSLETEFLFKLNSVFQQLITLNTKYGYIKTLKTLHQFYIQLLNNEKLSFRGEPLSGLQLMGILETRVLDFETVIITSVNEGILPAGRSENSFIPFDVKKEVGIPTYQDKNAIFSYHFHRLLQRAKNIYLLYNTENDQYGSGEQSRFITHLEINSPHKIVKKIVSPKTISSSLKPINIFKNIKIIEALERLAQKGLSPTTLTLYIYNPLEFYTKKILGIQETEEVEETIAVNTLGTIIHKTLESIYLPFIGKVLTVAHLEEIKKDIPFEVKKWFKREYINGDINSGKNLLIYNISKQYVYNFLDFELSLIKNGKVIKILALERTIETTINIEGFNYPIKLKGQVDRIDELDGVLRVIDYKSGKVEQRDVEIFEWDSITTDYKKYSKSFQILMYAYLLNNTKAINLPLEAGIISFKNLNSGFLKFGKKEKASSRIKETFLTQEILDNFEIQLKRLITEIFNSEIPFKEKENSNK